MSDPLDGVTDPHRFYAIWLGLQSREMREYITSGQPARVQYRPRPWVPRPPAQVPGQGELFPRGGAAA